MKRMQNSLISYLYYREIHLSQRNYSQPFTRIPTSLIIPIDDILDANEELKQVILLGFTKDGNYLLSYKIHPSSFHYILVFWEFRLRNPVHKVAEVELFDADEDAIFHAYQSWDETYFVLTFQTTNPSTLKLTIVPSPLKLHVRHPACPLIHTTTTYTADSTTPTSIHFALDNTVIVNSGADVYVISVGVIKYLEDKCHRAWWKELENDGDEGIKLSRQCFLAEGFLRALKIAKVMDLVDYELHVVANDPLIPTLLLLLQSDWNIRDRKFIQPPQTHVHLLSLNPLTGALLIHQTWSLKSTSVQKTRALLLSKLRERLRDLSVGIYHGVVWDKFVGNEGILSGGVSMPTLKHPLWPTAIKGPKENDYSGSLYR